VASVVNAIGESQYWSSSAIIVVWDDWGGWYDNAPLPQLDFRGLGMRVPCIIISPYAKQNHVTHTQLEFASILKFIEEIYNLGSIGPGGQGYSDRRANDLHDAFDFRQKPRPFTPIGSKYKTNYFLHEPPSYGPVDTE
jgi:phospholipase C